MTESGVLPGGNLETEGKPTSDMGHVTVSDVDNGDTEAGFTFQILSASARARPEPSAWTLPKAGKP